MVVATQELTHVGADKVQRYKWTVRDEPGQYAMVSKHDLKVDRRYQRDHTTKRGHAKVLRIARWFAWAAFSVLIVGRRANGDLYIIDGSHRHAATKLRSDIQYVPCLIFDSKGAEAEAEAFGIINNDRKAMTGAERLLADITAQKPDAVAIDHLIEQTGRKMSPSSRANTISCISNILSCWKADQAALVRIWPVLTELFRDHVWHGKLTQALHYIEANAADDTTLTDRVWMRAIREIGPAGLWEAASKYSSIAGGKTGARVWGEGIRLRLNRGRTSNKIHFERPL